MAKNTVVVLVVIPEVDLEVVVEILEVPLQTVELFQVVDHQRQ